MNTTPVAPPRAMVVFVVDDEWTIAMSLAVILRRKGFDAASYTNPLDALEAAKERAPDLLISDVSMPQLSGVDLAMRVCGQYPDCKVLLVSGQAQTSDLLEGARHAGHDFLLLTKPVHPAELLLHITQLSVSSNRLPQQAHR